MSPTISRLSPPGPSVFNTPLYSTNSASSTSCQPPDLFLYAASIRNAVFVHEQQCAIENEIDANDAQSWHWICFAPEKGGSSATSKEELENVWRRGPDLEEKTPVATVRLVPVDPPSAEGPSHGPTTMWNGREPYIKIGRLATLASHRGLGLGKLIMNETLRWAGSNREILSKGPGGENNGWDGLVLVHAQKDVEHFYAGIGFVKDEGLGIWWEESIEHRGMWRRV